MPCSAAAPQPLTVRATIASGRWPFLHDVQLVERLADCSRVVAVDDAGDEAERLGLFRQRLGSSAAG